ncbi:hypothetical protein Cch01nite_27950 [Cellulomonas chitinilytica]|uniref:DUF1905 domain-containing protein n=1 Tax=Cellulomonas chitinilytica TaxID=398759 RepID=A0A919U270_9CELL|nr:DUF1905 domain-containing protein [Cellulomonas chitinilytica]GIG22071.1 hypothetical protein Cch01nite_27950 [Cellulomonas chitinilytica]
MDLLVRGEIWYWRGPAPYHYVTVPEPQSDDIHDVARDVTYGWGMIPVVAQIGGTTWETSLFPKDGLYVVPIKDEVRAAEGLDVGDVVTVGLEVRPRR